MSELSEISPPRENNKVEALTVPKNAMKYKSANNVTVDNFVDDKEMVFTEHEIAMLYRAKCADLKINMYPVQFMRFRDSINKVCYNRKCMLNDMHFGPKLMF